MVRTATYFTLSQAAAETGKSKSVIYKALKDGTLSRVGKDDSGYQIDPAELFRVFPKNAVLERERERSRTPKRTGENGGENASFLNALEIENKLLQARLIDKEERIAELKAERDRMIEEKDRWHEQAERLLLTYQPTKRPEMPLQSETGISAGAVPDTLDKGPQTKNLAQYWVIIIAGMVATMLSLAMSYYAPEIKTAFDGTISHSKERQNTRITAQQPAKTASENEDKHREERPKEPLSSYPQSYPPTP